MDGVTNLNLGNNTGALVTHQPGRAGGGEDPHLELPGRVRPRRRRLHRAHHPLGHQRLPRRPALLPAPRELQRQQLLQQRQRPAQAALPLRLLRLGLRRPVPFVRHARSNRKIFFFAAQEYYEQQTPAGAAAATSACPPRPSAAATSRRPATATAAIVVARSADRPAVPRQRHPVRAASRRACGRCSTSSRRRTPPRAARSTTTPRSSPRDIPRREDIFARRLADRPRDAAERPLHPQQGRGRSAPRHDHRRLQLPAGRLEHRPQERAGQHAARPPLTHTFSPTLINEFVYGLGRGGVFIGPVDLTTSTRASSWREHAAPLPAAPTPTTSMPSVRFLGIANQACPATGVANCATPVTDFNGTPFDQKFVINNFMDNLTKWSGRHTLQGRGLLPARQQPAHLVRAGAVEPRVRRRRHPAEHRPPVRQRAPRRLRHLHAGRAEDHEQLLLPGHLGLPAGHLEGQAAPDPRLRPARLALPADLRPARTGSASSTRISSTPRARCGSTGRSAWRLARARASRDRPRRHRRRRRSPTRGPPTTSAPRARLRRPRPTASAARPTAIPRAASRRASCSGARAWASPGTLRGDAKTVVRGGFGITYDRIDTDRVADAITNPPGIQVVDAQQRQLSRLAGAGRSDLIPVNGDVVG